MSESLFRVQKPCEIIDNFERYLDAGTTDPSNNNLCLSLKAENHKDYVIFVSYSLHWSVAE